MSCNCNCHYGVNEYKCKNCLCITKTTCPTCNQFIPKKITVQQEGNEK